MTRQVFLRLIVYSLLILCITLPALADPVRSRPVGRYKYLMTYSITHNGETESTHRGGRLSLSGRRIFGRTYAGCQSFNFRIPVPVQDVQNQNAQARGGRFTSECGYNRSRLTVNARIQQTRRGTWKISANFTGVTVKGPKKGRKVSGRIVADSI